jgi:single-strand DNA-binding protein
MLNRVMLIGRLGKDPEVRTLDNGTPVAKFTLATTEVYKDREGNKQEQTEWHDIVCWRQLATLSEQWLKKGMLIYVEGKLSHRKYQDKDNNTRYITEVVADTFKRLERREGDALAKEHQTTTETSTTPVVEQTEGDDLPF